MFKELNAEVLDFDLSTFKQDFAGATSIDQQLVTVRKVNEHYFVCVILCLNCFFLVFYINQSEHFN